MGPLDVVKIRFQVQLEPISLAVHAKKPPHYHGFLHAFRTIVAEEGIKVGCSCWLPACCSSGKRQWHFAASPSSYTTSQRTNLLRWCLRCRSFLNFDDQSHIRHTVFAMPDVQSAHVEQLPVPMAAGDQYLLLLLLLQGLWQGTVPGMLLTIPYTAVQFVALQQCKDAAAKLGWEGV